MRTSLALFCIAVGCGTSAPEAPIVPPPPPPVELPPLPDVDPPAVPDPHADDCPTNYTSEDANAVFGAAGSWSSARCTFDGVRVRGSSVTLTWKKSGADAPIPLTVAPAGCAEGTAYGTHVLASEDAMAAACPKALAALKQALKDDRFPPATGKLVRQQAGPDGDGIPPAPGPAEPASSDAP